MKILALVASQDSTVEDVKTNGLQGYDVVINAGRAYSAWSGGDNWRDAERSKH